MSRRSHRPDDKSRRFVEAMAMAGIPECDIARVVGIDPKTLRKHYRQELDSSHIRATARVAANLFRIACGDGREAVTAAIFWMKTRAGWSERVAAGEIPEKLGKKELAARAALTAGDGTDWGDDLKVPLSVLN